MHRNVPELCAILCQSMFFLATRGVCTELWTKFCSIRCTASRPEGTRLLYFSKDLQYGYAAAPINTFWKILIIKEKERYAVKPMSKNGRMALQSGEAQIYLKS